MYAIEVQEREAGTLVALRGELDLFALEDLRRTLDAAGGLGTTVDLSGVTFLDLLSTRELAVRAYLYRSRFALQAPSAEVVASIEAARLQDWVSFRSGAPERSSSCGRPGEDKDSFPDSPGAKASISI